MPKKKKKMYARPQHSPAQTPPKISYLNWSKSQKLQITYKTLYDMTLHFSSDIISYSSFLPHSTPAALSFSNTLSMLSHRTFAIAVSFAWTLFLQSCYFLQELHSLPSHIHCFSSNVIFSGKGFPVKEGMLLNIATPPPQSPIPLHSTAFVTIWHTICLTSLFVYHVFHD